jgi:hypothetical protein
MKQSPQNKNIEDMLRSSKLALYGFLGDDPRTFNEIIDSDLAEIAKTGFTVKQIADRLRQITEQATPFLGNKVDIDQNLQARVVEAKGRISCPWPHPARFDKRVTTLTNIQTGQSIQWSDLNIHLIEAHNFFEGHGSPYRLNPAELINFIF